MFILKREGERQKTMDVHENKKWFRQTDRNTL